MVPPWFLVTLDVVPRHDLREGEVRIRTETDRRDVTREGTRDTTGETKWETVWPDGPSHVPFTARFPASLVPLAPQAPVRPRAVPAATRWPGGERDGTWEGPDRAVGVSRRFTTLTSGSADDGRRRRWDDEGRDGPPPNSRPYHPPHGPSLYPS